MLGPAEQNKQHLWLRHWILIVSKIFEDLIVISKECKKKVQ